MEPKHISDEQLIDYIENELTREDAAQIGSHIAECSVCHERLISNRQVIQAMRMAPQPDLQGRIHRTVHAQIRDETNPVPPSTPERKSRAKVSVGTVLSRCSSLPWWWYAAAAAIVILMMSNQGFNASSPESAFSDSQGARAVEIRDDLAIEQEDLLQLNGVLEELAAAFPAVNAQLLNEEGKLQVVAHGPANEVNLFLTALGQESGIDGHVSVIHLSATETVEARLTVGVDPR